MKKIISILLAVILLAGTMPMVMAEEIENAEAPVEVAETPAEAPAEVPAEAPAEVPAEPAAEPVEVPAEPAEAPAEAPAEPAEAPTEAPVEAPAEPAAEPAEVPAEPAEAPAEAPVEVPAEPAAAPAEVPAEPAEAPAEEPAAQVSFTGSLSVNIPMPVATGAEASLRAVVSNANMGYSIWWEIQDVEKKWQRIEGATGEIYKFTVNKTSGSYPIRCALRAEDGTVLYSSAPVKVKEQEAAPAAEAEAPAEVPAEEPETPAEEPEVPAEEAEVPAEEPEAPAEELVNEETETEEPAAEESEEIPAEEEETVDLDEIEDYETPLGLGEEKAAPVYAYEKDEDGNLILDENGNPIVTVIEGDEIPVTYLRNEDGELILDEKGDPIPTQTVPTDAVISSTLEDALDPNRTIDIYYSWNNEKPAIGGEVVFIAVLNGYDNLEYTIQWQQSKNNEDWTDIPDSFETRHTEIVTRDNYKDFWRVQVIITGVNE